MHTNKTVSAFVGAVSVLGLALTALPAAAAPLNLQYYQIAGMPTFTGTGGPGSTFFAESILTNVNNHSQVVGYRSEWCVITTPPMMWCTESNVITGKGSILTQGDVNRATFEAGVPTGQMPANGTGGIYSGRYGYQILQQIVFPNEILIKIRLN